MSVVNTTGNSHGIQPTQGGVDVFALKKAVSSGGGATQASDPKTQDSSSKSASLDAQHKQVNDALDAILKKLEPRPKSLQFSVNRELDQIVVKVVDTQTNKVVFQIPSEAIIKASEQLKSLDGGKLPIGSLLSEQA